MSYSAIVCRIKTKEHPNADKIQLGECAGFQVIVGLDVLDNDLGVYFPCDGQLSDEFCQLNNLYPVFDEQGKKIGGGFFEPKNRRVRAQGFRGEKSYGFWVPMSYFEHDVYSGAVLLEGSEFTEVNGRPVCNKYVTENTLKAQGHQKKQRKENDMFPKHFDTKQFSRELGNLDLTTYDNIIITEKLHGTSFRYGRVLEDKKLSLIERLALKLGLNIQTKEWVYLMGSRNVILEHTDTEGFYGSDQFRYDACATLNDKLHKGEIIYGEIVGFFSGSKAIMNRVSTKGLNDKTFRKKYGDEMTFSYGCVPGQAKIYVYRITQANEDGNIVELTWSQVKERCNELGVQYVPELEKANYQNELIDNDLAHDLLTAVVEANYDGESTLDNSHIREGVCVRLERGFENTILKHKNFEFYVLEGILKDEGVEDLEESA